MCGIGGWFCPAGPGQGPELLGKMMDLVSHRGPDGQGFFFSSAEGQGRFSQEPPDGGRWPVGLGHRRLAIVDLTATGRQPMTNEDESLWLTYNGEVYNHLELRQELQGLGHQYRSTADSESILHGYEAWGLEVFSRLNGMFALALWDGRQGRLVLARDRMSIKPLYYCRTPEGLYFASEIKQLLARPGLERRVNQAALRDFLVHGYLDHTGSTLFEGVNQLPPAHYLVAGRDGRVSIERYHEWPEPAGAEAISRDDRRFAALRLRGLLDDSVRLRLRADVPVGSCLSGGLDSSAVVCLAARRLQQGTDLAVVTPPDQHVFTAIYDDPAVDERSFAGLTSKKSHARPHTVLPTAQGLFDELEKLVWHQDEPTGTASVYAQFKVMELVKSQRIKVTLDGQGADELLAGYLGYGAIYLAQLIRSGRYFELLKGIKGFIGQGGFGLALRRLAEAGANMTGRPVQVPLWRRQWFDEEFLAAEPLLPERCRDDLGWRLLDDATRLNIPRLLHYADRTSMAHGVEARLPFLDYRLANFLLAQPPGFKIHQGWTKHSLRLAMDGLVPDEICWRRDKVGFDVPQKSWLNQGADQVRAILGPRPTIAPLFKIADWPAHIEENLKTDNGIDWLWQLLSLEVWAKIFKVSF